MALFAIPQSSDSELATDGQRVALAGEQCGTEQAHAAVKAQPASTRSVHLIRGTRAQVEASAVRIYPSAP